MTASDTSNFLAERKRVRRHKVARRLYEQLVAQNPNRVITLRDGAGKVIARHDLRPDEDATQSRTAGSIGAIDALRYRPALQAASTEDGRPQSCVFRVTGTSLPIGVKCDDAQGGDTWCDQHPNVGPNGRWLCVARCK